MTEKEAAELCKDLGLDPGSVLQHNPILDDLVWVEVDQRYERA